MFHYFYLWNILCNRFFCRSDEQIIPCTIFLTGDYIPSRWHPCGLLVILKQLTSSVPILNLMSVQYTPVWVSSLFRHAEKRLLRIVPSAMNILHNICMFSFLFFFVGACVCMIWCGWLTGLHSPSEAITHLNKNDEPPSETLCLPLTA